ncbi:MAG: TolC family protein, partial [Candidatus Scalindua sp.]
MNYPVHNIKYVTIVTLFASILFLTSHVSLAQISDPTRREEITAETVNLEKCITKALENNLQLAAARNRIGTAEAERIRASLLFPSNPNLSGEFGERDSPDGNNTTDFTVQLSQEFQVFGQRRKRINVSDKLIERVKFEIADVERN